MIFNKKKVGVVSVLSQQPIFIVFFGIFPLIFAKLNKRRSSFLPNCRDFFQLKLRKTFME